MTATIVVADRVPADRAAFTEALKGSPYQVVAEAAHGDALLEAVDKLKPWCVAMDLLLPGHADKPADGGVHAMKKVLGRPFKPKVLVIHDVNTAHLVMGALQTGAGSRVRKPFKREALLEALAKLNTGQEGERAVKQMGVRLKRSFVVHYKGVNEGFFAKKREAVTTDLSETGIGMATGEKIAKGTVLNVEVDLPGESPVKAKCQAMRVEHVTGMQRYDVGLTFVEMDQAERDRLKKFISRMVERGTGIIKA